MLDAHKHDLIRISYYNNVDYILLHSFNLDLSPLLVSRQNNNKRSTLGCDLINRGSII